MYHLWENRHKISEFGLQHNEQGEGGVAIGFPHHNVPPATTGGLQKGGGGGESSTGKVIERGVVVIVGTVIRIGRGKK